MTSHIKAGRAGKFRPGKKTGTVKRTAKGASLPVQRQEKRDKIVERLSFTRPSSRRTIKKGCCSPYSEA
jgi:DNA invertase Pin-like site-specific DNA recombinase